MSSFEPWLDRLTADLRGTAFGDELEVLNADLGICAQDSTLLVVRVAYFGPNGDQHSEYTFKFDPDELFRYVSDTMEAFDDPQFPQHVAGASVVILLLAESLMTDVWSTTEANYIDLT